MSKTLHQVMEDALTSEEYKNFCVEFKRGGINLDSFIPVYTPNQIIGQSFIWANTEQGRNYWSAIVTRLQGDQS